MDYGEHFRERSFNVRRVVKPADCLVRYRYPFVCGLIDPARFPIANWRERFHNHVRPHHALDWQTPAEYLQSTKDCPSQSHIP